MKQIGIQLNDNSDNGALLDLKIDVVRDDSGKIIQGIVVGETKNQNQATIIIANPGDFFFMPTLGASIDNLLLDNDFLRTRHRIREHLAKDGLIVKKLELYEGKPLVIEADYE
ncbi:hypothetical protein [Flavobacterium suncheonense]|uniref:Uncharacterized protein n=1 Tax=Flavobacterium suncheonense GH29-5 = DSM 17707 TaxID=1121899 RepID=A0A0A2MBV5_9FLAO|nr:hypothetical protein [Flavobacterium suncheonense]KGO89734.1 hypothetical protein Q764_05935 [Flavobacterium suncheonense GH29-5 = DSM 17707]